MKVSEYIAQFLVQAGVNQVFGVTGGAVVHLFDSISKTKGIQPIFTHHEQAAALAAGAYARTTNKLGACIVTTGPGGTNTLTGVLACWLDSIPCLFISGQTRFIHTSRGKQVRQIGSQEFDIVSTAQTMTKYAVMVDDPKKIQYIMQKAAYIACHDRPGPVWIDIPWDFQQEDIAINRLASFTPPKLQKKQVTSKMQAQIEKCCNALINSKRPLILAGCGVRLAHAEQELHQLIDRCKFPLVTSWNAGDILTTESSSNIGRVGLFGQRGANTAIENCDFLLTIGSHLCLTITGLHPENFAPQATKALVDIDPMEINHCLVPLDIAIEVDAKVFLQTLIKLLEKKKGKSQKIWKKQCHTFKSYNAIQARWRKQQRFVNPYTFIDVLSDTLSGSETIVVDGGGTIVYMCFQAFKTKRNQRLMLSTGICSMGTGLPESIGACFAGDKGLTICMIGDGSFQFNLQELQTIVHHALPIKVFVLNNQGYLSIRHTQAQYLHDRYVGSTAKGGISLPSVKKIAGAYGIDFMRITTHQRMKEKIAAVLDTKKPVVCEIMISPTQQLLNAQ